MSQIRYQRMKQAIKRIVSKPVVAFATAFTLLTAGPMLAPRRAQATDFLVCKEYDQDKIIARFDSLSKQKKTDVKKLKTDTIFALECIAKKGYLKMSVQLFVFLNKVIDGADKNALFGYLSTVKWLRYDKQTPKNVPRRIADRLFYMAESNIGTKVASEALEVAFEYIERFKIKPDYPFLFEPTSKAGLCFSKAEFFSKFGAPADAKKAALELAKFLNDKKRKEAAASALYEYMQYSKLVRKKPNLGAALQSKVEQILSEKQKAKTRFNALAFLAYFGSDKVAISAIDSIDRMIKTSIVYPLERYKISNMLLDIAHSKPMTKVASRALTAAFSQRNLPFGCLLSEKDVRLQRATMFLYFGAPEDAKKAVVEIASFFNDRKLMTDTSLTFTPYSRTRRKHAATVVYQYNLWITNPEIRKLKFGECTTCQVKLDPAVLKQADSILSKHDKENMAWTARDFRMMEASMSAQKYQRVRF